MIRGHNMKPRGHNMWWVATKSAQVSLLISLLFPFVCFCNDHNNDKNITTNINFHHNNKMMIIIIVLLSYFSVSDHKNNINNGPWQHRSHAARSCRSGRRGRSTASIFCRSILSIGPSGTAARADPRYNNKINNDNDIYCYDNPNNINIVNNNNNSSTDNKVPRARSLARSRSCQSILSIGPSGTIDSASRSSIQQ